MTFGDYKVNEIMRGIRKEIKRGSEDCLALFKKVGEVTN